jgi:hypothetical protein
MKKLLALTVGFLILGFAFAAAQDQIATKSQDKAQLQTGLNLVNPTISGTLYWRLRDTKTGRIFEAPASGTYTMEGDTKITTPDEVLVYYWQKKKLQTSVVGKVKDGQVVAVNAPGQATVNPDDGTFSVTVNREALPTGVNTVSLVYRHMGRDQVVKFKLPGAGAKAKADSRIDISDGRPEIDLGRIQVY